MPCRPRHPAPAARAALARAVVEALEPRRLLAGIAGQPTAEVGEDYPLQLVYGNPNSAWDLDWGDGAAETVSGGNYLLPTHRYAAGTYTPVATFEGRPHPLGLDGGFGQFGRAVVDLGSWEKVKDVSLESDAQGRVVAAGDSDGNFALVRLLPGGAMDPSFGSGGKVFTDFGATDRAEAVAVQPDGKIVAAGYGGSIRPGPAGAMFALARYLPDGTLDPSFGSGGKVTTDFGAYDWARAVRVLPDGKILAAGSSGGWWAMARYLPDGSLDPTFGTGGRVTTNVDNGVGIDMDLQPDGKIVVVGTAGGNRPGGARLGIVRYLPNGGLDTTFGNGGGILHDLSSGPDQGTAVAVLPTGKIVVTRPDAGGGLAVSRFTALGALDATFGAGGTARVAAGVGGMAHALLVGADGSLTVGGETDTFPAFARFTADGAPDPTFGIGGFFEDTWTPGSNAYGASYSLARRPDGKIVSGGTLWGQFALHQLLPDNRLVVGPGSADPAGGGGGGDPASGPPAAPTDLVAVATRSDRVTLSWTNNAGAGAGFEIERQVDGGEWELLATAAAGATSYADAAVWGATAFDYRVRATNSFGGSGYSSTVTSTTPAAIPPAAPSNLAFGSVFSDGVQITWADNSDDEDYFQVGWSNGDGQWINIAEVEAGTTYYTDEYPALGSGNRYRVSAVREDVEETVVSLPSNEESVKPIAPPVAWYDDNAGHNDLGTLSPFATIHDRATEGNVLHNDADYDSPTLQPTLRVIVDGASETRRSEHGQVTLRPDGSFTYAPDQGFVGTDTFTYSIYDGEADSREATAAVDVTNAPPVARSVEVGHPLYDSYSAEPGTVQPLTGTLSATDADEDHYTFVKVSDPEHGTVTVDPATGAFTYLVNSTFAGRDRFTVAATDGVEQGPEAVVSIVSHFKLIESNSEVRSSVARVNSQMQSNGYVITTLPGLRSADRVVGDLQHGDSLTVEQTPGLSWYSYQHTPGVTGRDQAVFAHKTGIFELKPVTYNFQIYDAVDPSPTWGGLNRDFLFYGVPAVGPRTFSAQQTAFIRDGYSATLKVGQQPANGRIDLAGDGSFTFTPTAPAAGEDPYLGWDFFSLVATEADGYAQEQWVQLDVGYDVAPAPVIVTDAAGSSEESTPVSGWTATPFDGTLVRLNSVLSKVEARKNQVLARLEKLGERWQTIHNDPDESADAVLANADGAVSALDEAREAFKAYEQGWLELNADAVAYQKTYAAFVDNWYSSYNGLDTNDDALDSYNEVLGAIQALPRDIGGLRPNDEFLEKIGAALEEFGDAAGVQSNLAGTVYTVADTSHKALERAEFTLGLATGGTYSAATLLTKQGLKLLVKRAARNWAEDKLVEAGLSPAVAPVAAAAAAAAAELGLNATYVQAGALALQATGVVKKVGTPKAGGKWSWRFGSGKQKVTSIKVTKVRWTKVSDEAYDILTKEFNNGRRKQFLQDLVKDKAKVKAMRKAGLDKDAIDAMRSGNVPVGYQVHHKKPRRFGGDNQDANLMLIKSAGPNLHGQITALERGLRKSADRQKQNP